MANKSLIGSKVKDPDSPYWSKMEGSWYKASSHAGPETLYFTSASGHAHGSDGEDNPSGAFYNSKQTGYIQKTPGTVSANASLWLGAGNDYSQGAGNVGAFGYIKHFWDDLYDNNGDLMDYPFRFRRGDGPDLTSEGWEADSTKHMAVLRDSSRTSGELITTIYTGADNEMLCNFKEGQEVKVSLWFRACPDHTEYYSSTVTNCRTSCEFDLYIFGCDSNWNYNFSGHNGKRVYNGDTSSTSTGNGNGTGKSYYYLRDIGYSSWEYAEFTIAPTSSTSLLYLSIRLDVNTNGETSGNAAGQEPGIDVCNISVSPINVSMKSMTAYAIANLAPTSDISLDTHFNSLSDWHS